MPSWSGAGNISPVSTTTIRPPYSTTIMFLPISPSPPSGRTRSVIAHAAGDARCAAFAFRSSHRGEQVVTLERLADHRPLLVRGLHERQPHRAHVLPNHVESRLHRDRVRRDEHRLVEVAEAILDLVAALGLVDDPSHLGAHEMRRHQDAAAAA